MFLFLESSRVQFREDVQGIGIDCMSLADPEIMEASFPKNLILTSTRTIKYLF